MPHCSNSNTYYYFIVYLAWNICIQKTGQYRKCCSQYQLIQVQQRFWNLTYSWLHIKTTRGALKVPMLKLVGVVQSLCQVRLFDSTPESTLPSLFSVSINSIIIHLLAQAGHLVKSSSELFPSLPHVQPVSVVFFFFNFSAWKVFSLCFSLSLISGLYE